MSDEKRDYLEAVIHTKDGRSFAVWIGRTREFSARSLTDESLHSFERRGGGTIVIQGSNISCIEALENA